MRGHRGDVRRVVTSFLPLVGLWAAVWAVLAAAGWRPRPLGLLAAVVLVAGLARLARVLASFGAALPRVDVRVDPTSAIGEDHRLLRHQLHLEDATADPPSCRPVLTRICELARDRARLVHGHDIGAGAPVDPAVRRLLGERLSAVLDDRPPDRTHLSPHELSRLVEDLEAL
jgi:hypothetical protein